jgi:hypothetical protein
MYLIDSNGSVLTVPTPAALGTEGFFGGGNPGAGQLATQVTADWLNTVQNNMVVLNRVVGATDSKTDYTQLYQAVLSCARLVDTGAVNALAGAPSVGSFAALPALSAIPDGFTVRVVPAFANTSTTPGFAFNGGSPVTITTPLGAPLGVGDVQAGVPVALMKAGGASPTWWLLGGIAGSRLAHGECQLQYLSVTSLQLVPKNGNNLMVGSAQWQLPAAGVTLTNSGLADSTLYYIYAGISGGAIVLTASTTGHNASSSAGNVGVEVMSGNVNETLVGMAWTNSSGQFGPACVASWFNRRASSYGGVTETPTTTSATFAQLTGTAVDFVTWGDEAVRVAIIGSASVNAGSIVCRTSTGIDGATAGAQTEFTSTASGNAVTVAPEANYSSASPSGPLSEGHHIASAFGAVDGVNTGTWSIGTEISMRL